MFVKCLFRLMVILLMNCSIYVKTSNILCIAPYDINSHYRVFRGVFLELANRGHSVTVISPYEEKNAPKNFHHVKVNGAYFGNVPFTNSEGFNSFEVLAPTSFVTWIFLIKSLHRIGVEGLLTSFKDFVDNDNTKFDLVIAEDFNYPPLFLIAHKYKAPLITYVVFGGAHWVDNYMGNPMNLHYVAHEWRTFPSKMTLLDRVMNVGFTGIDIIMSELYDGPRHIEFSNSYFDKMEKPLPNLLDVQKNTSLVFYNTHFSMDMARPNLPNIIEIAGLHINPMEELPEDLQAILDNAEHGAIYFSMGSVLKSQHMPQHKIDIFLEVFGKLRQIVLWKWEKEGMPNKPKNVIIRKWFPQGDILGHPKVRLFITHGGLLSVQEAAHHGVPIVGIPIYADQPSNVLLAKEMGYAESIDYINLNTNETYRTIEKVLNDPKYLKTAKKLSAIVKDRPMSPMETAIFWIEYVIRHKGAYHMKTPSSYMPWYEYYLLDVIAVMTIGAVVVMSFVFMLIKYCLGFVIKRCTRNNISGNKKYN